MKKKKNSKPVADRNLRQYLCDKRYTEVNKANDNGQNEVTQMSKKLKA